MTPDPATQAVELAAALLREANRRERRGERNRRARLARMLEDPAGKRTMLALIDEVVRIHQPRRAARRLRDLVEADGAPSFLGPVDRMALRAGAALAPVLPRVVMPLVTARLRRESGGVILPAEDPAFTRYVKRRRREGVRLNVNVLGEAILGDDEAGRRLDAVLARLRRPDVDYVSVKISSIASQLNVLAFDATVERVAGPLRRLYAEAAAHSPAKFVNLDMEEYRDLGLTLAVFQRVLGEPPFHPLDAGLVLQAYLPDSYGALAELCEWALDRHDRGGGRVKVRVVKGANLAMERVDAELHGWPQAPYSSKAEVDANYKRMLDVVLHPRYAGAVRLGVASHNLFDVAWALVLREAAGAVERVDMEMLEGMAESQAMAVKDRAGGVLLYAPVVERHDFEAAIAYLVRRLDENTAPDNFLRSLFSLEPGSAPFVAERDRFLAAVDGRRDVDSAPRRTQDRSRPAPPSDPEAPFVNEPDTDFSLAANRDWIVAALAAWSAPSVPGVADMAEVEQAVAVARRAGPRWAAAPLAERRAILGRVADVMGQRRGETLAAMAHDAGKTVGEGDPEVSEAIDFARWYATCTRVVETIEADGLAFAPLGTVVVASPWNFPYAIPAGGVLAALAAGNAVILKPAPETVLTAWLLASHCWEAGVPRDVLQFLPCPDDDVGRRLITHPDVDAVVLTGAWDTAQMFLDWKPELRLHAETSGKNATVVTAAADLDAAVHDIVHSAFSHAGQKCSAASLVIAEAGVHNDPSFLRRLADAVRSVQVGPATELTSIVGPLVRAPAGPLHRALHQLDAGESWLVEPRPLESTPHLWSPGVKVGVQPGSFFHLTECFGPVLGVMQARDLDQAIEWQNAVAYGLTGGLHSLDPAEVARWVERVEVGNAYVNRGTTGAVVRRQPFGGWKRSVVGPTFKAGGPNYVLSLGHWSVAAPGAEPDYDRWWRDEFAVDHDPSGLRAERNVFRYRPLPHGVLVRAGDDDSDVALALAAARVTGTRATVSSARPLAGVIGAVIEDEAALAARLGASPIDRLRLLGGAGAELRRAAHRAGVVVDDAPVVPHGRVELLHWLREQSISETRHRHGNPRE